MTRQSVILSMVAPCFAAFALFADSTTPSQQEKASCDAVATPLVSTTVKFGYNDTFRGIITYVAAPGAILRGTSYGLDGKVVEPGDVLVHMETDYRQSVVDGKLALYRASCATLQAAKDNYERYGRLIKTSAASIEDYQHVEAAYLEAIGNRDSAKSDLQLAQIIRDACVFRAPFDSVVDSVFFPAGLCSGELDVVRISKLSPMGIKIPMSRENALKFIDSGLRAVIYPCGSTKPEPILPGRFQLLPDGIVVQVANRPLLPANYSDNGDVPLCCYESIIPDYYQDGNFKEQLYLFGSGIVTSPDGAFVWRVKGGLPKHGNEEAKVSVVEKVLIGKDISGDPDAIRCKRFAISSGGALKAFDVILAGHIPTSITDGSKVRCWKPRYIFMPGDPVKVSFDTKK